MHQSYTTSHGGRVNIGQSHFDAADEGWTLLESEEGWRTFQKAVAFQSAFPDPPHVHLSIVGLDFLHPANTRLSIAAKDVTTTGFTLEVATWADSQVWGCGVEWLTV